MDKIKIIIEREDYYFLVKTLLKFIHSEKCQQKACKKALHFGVTHKCTESVIRATLTLN